MRKLDEYLITKMADGTWAVSVEPNQRLLVFDSLEAVLQAIGRGLPEDYPNATRIVVTIEEEEG